MQYCSVHYECLDQVYLQRMWFHASAAMLLLRALRIYNSEHHRKAIVKTSPCCSFC